MWNDYGIVAPPPAASLVIALHVVIMCVCVWKMARLLLVIIIPIVMIIVCSCRQVCLLFFSKEAERRRDFLKKKLVGLISNGWMVMVGKGENKVSEANLLNLTLPGTDYMMNVPLSLKIAGCYCY